MQTINLIGSKGQFETSPCGHGQRTFGLFWANQINPGDLLIKPKIDNPSTLTAWKIISANPTFSGSDGNWFWEGQMIDLFVHSDHLTDEIAEILSKF